ncbi:MAG: glycosyltransferase [Candidatus Thermoplasmatota archaeon]|nr:glycosyltransferase [Candidatus Thermoplasmatota archaeon]
MQSRLLVAVRDLDALPGGAEKSLSTLLLGLEKNSENWNIEVFQSNDRKKASKLFDNSTINIKKCNIKIEDVYSGLAWRFRNRNTGRSMKRLRKIHLKKKNKDFFNWLKIELSKTKQNAEEQNERLLGVTQLDWSAGASSAFIAAKIPYVTFVRDEVCFEYPELFRECLENAERVIVAGEGLASQVKDKFSINKISIVHLPVDFEKLYPFEKLKGKSEEAKLFRDNNHLTNPRIAIVGMVPEKGFEFYNKKFIPKLKEIWPEATLHVYGGGIYAKKLSKYENTIDEGFCSPEEIYPYCDIHLFRLDRVGTWGRVINEAGYFSKPTISIDIGAQSEAVGNGGAVMSYESSAEEWINQIKEIYNDLERYSKLAFEHSSIVDSKSSINEFITVLDGVFND